MHSPTRGVVTASGYGVPAGVEPDAVDVGGVALQWTGWGQEIPNVSGLTNLEILHVVASPHVPQVSNIITSLRRVLAHNSEAIVSSLRTHSRHEGIEIGPGCQVYGHHVADVAVEGLQHGAGLHVPEGRRGVPGPRQHLTQGFVSWSLFKTIYYDYEESLFLAH